MIVDSKSVISTGLWSALERVGQQGIQIAVQLLLARLLGPEVFGLLAMLTIFYALAQAIVDGGLTSALIQKKQISDADTSSMFFFNIGLGVVTAGMIFAISPLVAAFYDEPVLKPMLQWLAVLPLVNSFGLVPQALLRRELKFRRILMASLPATAIAGVIGITLALLDYGVWALVVQMLSLRFLWVVFTWLASGWWPRWTYSTAAMGEMFGFGWKLMVAALSTVFFDNLYLLVIGKLFDAVTLGLYSNARRLQLLVSSNLAAIVMRVAFPVFSRLQDDTARMYRGLRRSNSVLWLTSSTICATMIATADPLFRGVLGEDWVGAIPIFRWLGLVALFYPLSAMNLNVLMALGRSDLFLILGLIKKALVLLNLLIAWRWGVMAIVYGQVALSVVSYFINAYYTGRFLNYPAHQQLRDGAGPLGLGAAAGLVMAAVALLAEGLPHLVVFAGQLVLGGAVWAVAGYTLRLDAFGELTTIFARRPNSPPR